MLHLPLLREVVVKNVADGTLIENLKHLARQSLPPAPSWAKYGIFPFILSQVKRRFEGKYSKSV